MRPLARSPALCLLNDHPRRRITSRCLVLVAVEEGIIISGILIPPRSGKGEA